MEKPEDYTESSFTDEDENKSNVMQGESILEKPLLNTFFDPEEILLNLEKTYKGYQRVNKEWVFKGTPIARTSFIDNSINILRSVINSQNFNSKLSSKQVDNILIEKNMEYIDMVRNEPKWSLKDEDCEMVINIFDHVLQTFLGIVENGRVTEVITQIATGNYNPDSFMNVAAKKKKGFIDNFFG